MLVDGVLDSYLTPVQKPPGRFDPGFVIFGNIAYHIAEDVQESRVDGFHCSAAVDYRPCLVSALNKMSSTHFCPICLIF